MLTWQAVRELGLALPEVEEGTSYGTPALKVRGKLMARLREEDVLVVKVDPPERDFLLRTRPKTYFVTPHYAGHPYVLVRLDEVGREELRELLTESWLYTAPRRLVEQLESADPGLPRHR